MGCESRNIDRIIDDGNDDDDLDGYEWNEYEANENDRMIDDGGDEKPYNEDADA